MEIEGSKTYKLMEEVKQRYNKFYSIVTIALVVMIGGIIIFILGPRDFGIVLMIVGGIIVIPMTFFLPLILAAQIKISKLYEKRESEKLLSYAAERSSLTKGNFVYFAVAALGDMREEKALPILEEILMKSQNNIPELQKKAAKAIASIGTDKAVIILRNALIRNEREINRIGTRGAEEQVRERHIREVSNVIKSTLKSLAKTNNYNSEDEMIRSIEKRRKRKVLVQEEYKGEKGVSFKIPYVEEEAKCMISQMRIDEEDTKILACPHCLNLVKMDLMIMWLELKNKCPVCRRTIEREECLQVEFIKKEKEEKEKEKE